MKTIIKLLIVLVIINALFRVGVVAAKYYQFKDSSQQLVTFGAGIGPGQLQNRIMDKATELEVPIDLDDITVTRDGFHTTATAAYTESVEVFPSYTYPIPFTFKVDGMDMGSNGRASR